MGTIPTPPTIATNQFVTSAVMNQYRDAINFWALTPRCYAWQNSAMTLTTGTWSWTPTTGAGVSYDLTFSRFSGNDSGPSV